MSRENFPKALSFAMSWEGGHTRDGEDPDDPGKETYKGISRHYWPHWSGWGYVDKGNYAEADKHVENFYLDNMWRPSRCDDMPYPLDIIVFDCAINPGPRLVNVLKGLKCDWRDMLMLRISYYNDRAKEGNKIKYLRGWINRTLALWRVLAKEV